MDKLRYSEKQISDILYDDLLSLIQDSKNRLADLEKQITDKPAIKETQVEFDKEYTRFLKLFSTLTKPLSTKEH